MAVRTILIILVLLAIFIVTGVIKVEGHHTGVSCGPSDHPGRAVCLPLADSSFAVRTLQQTGQLTYCFNQRAANYPGFVSQTRQTLKQHEQALGVKWVEIPGIYQTNTQAGAAGCQVWHSMPETHGCPNCGAWVHYLNSPVIIEYRWQAGYTDWKTTITHEVGHIYGLHEHYDDANFRSHRGSYGYWAHGMERDPGTAEDARTVMDFGMSYLYGNLAWQFSDYDVRYACENMDPEGEFFTGCQPEVECQSVGWDPCTERHFMADGWSYEPSTADWWAPDGERFWSPCRSWGGRDGPGFSAGVGTWVYSHARRIWAQVPAC